MTGMREVVSVGVSAELATHIRARAVAERVPVSTVIRRALLAGLGAEAPAVTSEPAHVGTKPGRPLTRYPVAAQRQAMPALDAG